MILEPLPNVAVSRMIGLLEYLEDLGGHADLFRLAERLNMKYGDLAETVRGASLLGWVETPHGDVALNEAGKAFLAHDVNARKRSLREALKRLQTFQFLGRLLEQAPGRAMPKGGVLEEIVVYLPYENPKQVLKTVVDWGRYAELIGYSADRDELYLDQA